MSPSGCDGEDFHVQALGPDVGWDEKPDVVEKAPVDAERERLLDLLERLVWGTNTPKYHEAKAVLREYGRLGKEES